MALKQIVTLTPEPQAWYPDGQVVSLNIFSLGWCQVSESLAADKLYSLGLHQEITIDPTGPVYLSGIGQALLTPSPTIDRRPTFNDLTQERVLRQAGAGAFASLDFTADRTGYVYVYYGTDAGAAGVWALTHLDSGQAQHVATFGPVPRLAFFLPVVPGRYRLALPATCPLTGATVAFTTNKPGLVLDSVWTDGGDAVAWLHTVNLAEYRGRFMYTVGAPGIQIEEWAANSSLIFLCYDRTIGPGDPGPADMGFIRKPEGSIARVTAQRGALEDGGLALFGVVA